MKRGAVILLSFMYMIPGLMGRAPAWALSSNSTLATSLTVTASPDNTPPTAPRGAAMTKSGNDLQLTWQAAADNVGVTGYRIYRSTAKSFVPGPAALIGTSAGTSFTDTGAVASSESFFYRITAQDAAGNESAPSNMGFKQRRVLPFHTNISNIYLVSFPYVRASGSNAIVDARSILRDIPNTTRVTRLNPDTQQLESLQVFQGNFVGTNFAVTTGEAYTVVTSAESTATLAGWHDSAFAFSRTFHSSISNIHEISIPYHGVYAAAADVLADIGPAATRISRINPDTQQVESLQVFQGSVVGTNFPVVAGEGVSVVINANIVWTPRTF